MKESSIKKDLGALTVPPNLIDDSIARRQFSWSEMRGELKGLPGGEFNIGFDLKLVLLVRDRVSQVLPEGCFDYWSEMHKGSEEFTTEPTSGEDVDDIAQYLQKALQT